VGPLIDDNGMLVSDDQHMGEILDRYFSSVFTMENQCAMPDVKNIYHGESSEKLCSIDITSDMVKSDKQAKNE